MRIVALLLAPALLACHSVCAMEPTLKDAAGSGAVACGKTALGTTGAVGACMTQAFDGGGAFWGYAEGQGEDSLVANGIACDGSSIWLFDYDGCPGGCGNEDPHIWRTDCLNPRSENGWIACDRGDRVQICP